MSRGRPTLTPPRVVDSHIEVASTRCDDEQSVRRVGTTVGSADVTESLASL